MDVRRRRQKGVHVKQEEETTEVTWVTGQQGVHEKQREGALRLHG
jgi:hypothetical protein